MREIKFRAWDGEKMIDTFSVQSNGDGVLYSGDIMGSWEIMQFTGLLDKNGKEIYEGDILMADEYVVEIKFKGGQFVGFNEKLNPQETQNRNWLQWEIIGNIYENPELLNA